MPIYEYRCDDCDALLEVMQKMSDDPLEVCDRCGGHLRRVLHPVAIHFKGSGFYTTDYGRGSRARPSKESGEPSPSSGDGSGDGSSKGKAETPGGAGEGAAGKPAKAKTPASS